MIAFSRSSKLSGRVGGLTTFFLPHRGHDESGARAGAARPAGRHRFEAGEEAYAFGPVHVVIAEERSLPAAEAMEGHGHGDGNVDAHHADLNALGELVGRVAARGKNGAPVSIAMRVDQIDGGV